MSWIDGPYDNNMILAGLQVFWWKRIFGLTQMVSGVSAVVDLVGRERKQAIHHWLVSVGRDQPPARRVTKRDLLRRTLIGIGIILLCTGVFSFVYGYAAL